MSSRATHGHFESIAEHAADGQPAASDLVKVADNPFETLLVAADVLQHAASDAASALSDVLPVAMLCVAVQRHSVELSLLSESDLNAPQATDSMAEPLNRGAQQGLASMRTLCERQHVLAGHIEQAVALLVTLAEQLQRRELAIELERTRFAQQSRVNAEVARRMVKHAQNIDRIMSGLGSQTQESS